jgi:hypothetical protein
LIDTAAPDGTDVIETAPTNVCGLESNAPGDRPGRRRVVVVAIATRAVDGVASGGVAGDGSRYDTATGR